jgi:hypothetical protein
MIMSPLIPELEPGSLWKPRGPWSVQHNVVEAVPARGCESDNSRSQTILAILSSELHTEEPVVR